MDLMLLHKPANLASLDVEPNVECSIARNSFDLVGTRRIGPCNCCLMATSELAMSCTILTELHNLFEEIKQFQAFLISYAKQKLTSLLLPAIADCVIIRLARLTVKILNFVLITLKREKFKKYIS